MNKKAYNKPALSITTLSQHCHLLAGSPSSTGPSANFMSNPGIGSRGSNSNCWDDEEDEM